MNILLIDDVGVPSPLAVIRSLGLKKHKIYLASLKPEKAKSNATFSKYLSESFILRSTQIDEIVNELCLICTEHEIDVVLPIKEDTFLKFSKLNAQQKEKLKLSWLNTPETYELVGDKLQLANWLKTESFGTPHTIALNSTNDFKNFKYPAILKPKTGAGGKGIHYLSDSDFARQLVASHDIVISDYVLQEFMSFDDIDISFLAEEGKLIAYTIQKGIVRNSFSFASGISFVHDSGIIDATQQIIKSLNWSGIAHLDFKYDSETRKYYLLDFNPRYWSTLLGSTSVGINFPHLQALAISGKNIDVPEYKTQNFFLSVTAIKQALLSMVRVERFSLRNSNLFYLFKDPLPELISVFRKN